MQLYKTEKGVVIQRGHVRYLKDLADWDGFINRSGLYQALLKDLEGLPPSKEEPLVTKTLPPIGNQEIWASGVTYMRSKQARIQESEKAGGGSFYDKVYDAERPELFFKASAQRTVGDGGTVRIRKDSSWDVPEPELTLFVCAEGTIEGYTIGNDMSSRSIEGENPLYLPQAKTYDGCAGLGPCIYVPENPISQHTEISLDILREDKSVFTGSIAINQMKRTHDELVSFLYSECKFPNGCFLMTGTGIVPPDSFTLQRGDEIRIRIGPIGTLTNYVG